MTGINEVELVQVRNLDITNAEFKELQFTEAGDYVLSITCTSDKIEPYELKVKVTKEDEITMHVGMSTDIAIARRSGVITATTGYSNEDTLGNQLKDIITNTENLRLERL